MEKWVKCMHCGHQNLMWTIKEDNEQGPVELQVKDKVVVEGTLMPDLLSCKKCGGLMDPTANHKIMTLFRQMERDAEFPVVN